MARGRRDSPVVWKYRPKGAMVAARMAWDAHVRSHPDDCSPTALQLVDGAWRAHFADGAVHDISQDDLKGAKWASA